MKNAEKKSFKKHFLTKPIRFKCSGLGGMNEQIVGWASVYIDTVIFCGEKKNKFL